MATKQNSYIKNKVVSLLKKMTYNNFSSITSVIMNNNYRNCGKTYLYRFYNKNKELLYVGISNDLQMRIASHRSTKEWWDQIIYIKVSAYHRRFRAQKAEKHAIQKEKPKYNIACSVV